MNSIDRNLYLKHASPSCPKKSPCVRVPEWHLERNVFLSFVNARSQTVGLQRSNSDIRQFHFYVLKQISVNFLFEMKNTKFDIDHSQNPHAFDQHKKSYANDDKVGFSAFAFNICYKNASKCY